ncbi:hypothetical protein N7449_009486 [Penicillium cf. viridicatum]|uniref:BTB domain-containing protein n=1 Tax=Penicillium cf. viridicatum TaxID=2972119 RepID=A0A9W9M948_9EURO|nr:hypothetical protein N7449_009486 [Penicillium cf. viridicatum]
MNQPTHTIDPDGEVIIILRNADLPFAPPPEVIEPPQPHSGRGKKKKKNKKKSSAIRTTPEEAPFFEPAVFPEPTPTEGPAAEEPILEPAAFPEPTPMEDHVPQQHVAEQPAVEEPAVEEEICEPLDENCFYIQVSAKHLIFASPVFKRILTGGWKESIAYLQKRSVEITAEGWDIEAFLVVLHAIHGKNYDIPRKLTLEILAKVAVIADYYECKECLYLMTDIWLNSMEEGIPTTYSRDLILWLWVSWFFQLPSQFKESTSAVISCSGNVITGQGFPISDKVIVSNGILGLINKSREEAINNLVLLLHATLEALLSRSRGCSFECSSIMYGALTMNMGSIHLLSPKPAAPFPSLNYNDLTQKVLSFTSPEWYDSSCRYSGYLHRCPDSSFASIFANLNVCVQGLDLNSLDSF